jgi:hypothetical protein
MTERPEILEFMYEVLGGEAQVKRRFYHKTIHSYFAAGRTLKEVLAKGREEGWEEVLLGMGIEDLTRILYSVTPPHNPKAPHRRRPRQVSSTPGVRITDHPLHPYWNALRRRCGDQGLVLHTEWENFEAFAEYLDKNLGPRPKDHVLARKNTDLGYVPGNIMWLPKGEFLARARRSRWPTIPKAPLAEPPP